MNIIILECFGIELAYAMLSVLKHLKPHSSTTHASFYVATKTV